MTRTAPLIGALVALTCLVLGVQASAAADGTCEDLLAVHRPDGSEGDTSTVAITSQSLERGVAGWASVGWSAADGVTVRVVEVTTPGGVEVLAGAAEGVTGPASQLRFCGHVDATAATPEVSDEVVAARPRDGGSLIGPLGVLGATTGLIVGAVVLLLSRAARAETGATG